VGEISVHLVCKEFDPRERFLKCPYSWELVFPLGPMIVHRVFFFFRFSFLRPRTRFCVVDLICS